VIGYGLDGQGSDHRSHAGQDFSLSPPHANISPAHPVSSLMDTWQLFLHMV